MDKFIVRFSIISLNIYMLIVLIYAFNGIDISDYDYIFTDSVLFGIVLTTVVHVQGRYHCKWIRALCYNLIIVPMINFVDCKFDLFRADEYLIYTYCGLLLLGIFMTIILAINHFKKVRKLKKQQHELRRRNKRQDR